MGYMCCWAIETIYIKISTTTIFDINSSDTAKLIENCLCNRTNSSSSRNHHGGCLQIARASSNLLNIQNRTILIHCTNFELCRYKIVGICITQPDPILISNAWRNSTNKSNLCRHGIAEAGVLKGDMRHGLIEIQINISGLPNVGLMIPIRKNRFRNKAFVDSIKECVNGGTLGQCNQGRGWFVMSG